MTAWLIVLAVILLIGWGLVSFMRRMDHNTEPPVRQGKS